MPDFKEALKKLFAQEKHRKLAIVAALIGIVLILFTGGINKSKSSKSPEKKPPVTFSTQSYTADLENRLTAMVSNIQGVGHAQIMVTLESSEETVYATEEKKNKEATEDKTGSENSKRRESDDQELRFIKVKDANGNEQALSVTQKQPKVKGVVVVCEGGADPEIRARVTDSLKAALNISAKRVFVTR